MCGIAGFAGGDAADEDLEPVALAQRLEGMFAFAIWDETRGRLVLARDRLGKKPLYYWTDGRQLVFGSELRSVLAHPDVPRQLNTNVLGPYLTFGYAPTPETFYEGVRSVPPGHVLIFRPGAGIELTAFWELTVPSPHLD